jgi:hypothetical protein
MRVYAQRCVCSLPLFILHIVFFWGAMTKGLQPSASWTYKPSQLEEAWVQNASQWSDDYCSHVPAFKDNITYWLATTKQLMLTPRYRLPSDVDGGGGVFSMFHKMISCGDHLSHTYSSWIEPLALSLRHPEAPCDTSKLLSREYLLLSSIIDVQLQNCGRSAQHFLFDLGASLWAEGGGGSSQNELVTAYAKRGIHFDRLICWEAAGHSVEEIYRDVPQNLMGKYTYYNFPVSSDISADGNPLNILKRITTTTDFVVFKLDIDNAPIENDFIHQILADPEIYNLIDEFIFEHHVNFKPMAGYWGGITNATYTLEYSYQVFTALRQRGIRAHGWP